MVEILQCGVRVVKRYAPPITRNSTSSLATRRISHRGFFPDWTVELSLNEAREGVDVISSVNQSDPSVLLARVPIGVRLECIRKINSFKELAVATTRPSSGARRYNGCICRKWTQQQLPCSHIQIRKRAHFDACQLTFVLAAVLKYFFPLVRVFKRKYSIELKLFIFLSSVLLPCILHGTRFPFLGSCRRCLRVLLKS